MLDDASPAKNKNSQPTKPFVRDSDPDFDAEMQSSDESDFGDVPDARAASGELAEEHKKAVNDTGLAYPGPSIPKENRPPPPITNPDHPGMSRFEIARSQTPVEIRNKRTIITCVVADVEDDLR